MRNKSIKVKTAKSRSKSSTEWLQRQLNDPFVYQAQIDGYRARAAYKLININEKFDILKPKMRIIDLGAAPGGWSQVASKILGDKGSILAVDIIEMAEIPNVKFLQNDFYELETIEKIISLFEGKADVILSDMAPNTIGHSATDHLKIMDLCERVFYFAKEILAINGALVVKIFQGGAEEKILSEIKLYFKQVKHFKPAASRSGSKEIYLVAKGFKG